MAYGDNDRAVGERNGARLRRDPAEIGPKLIDLTDVTEAGSRNGTSRTQSPAKPSSSARQAGATASLYERATHAP